MHLKVAVVLHNLYGALLISWYGLLQKCSVHLVSRLGSARVQLTMSVESSPVS